MQRTTVSSSSDMLRWSRLLCILLLVTKYGVVRSLKCPTSASDWDRASRALQCQLPNYYHCLRDESGAHTEQCLPRVWIQSEMCPEFNPRVSRIDVYRCSVANCPTSLYWSNAVFMYPICYESGSLISPTKQGPTTLLHNISMLTTTFGSLEYSEDESSADTLPVAAIIGITIGVVCLVGVFIVLLMYKRRRKETDNASNMELSKSNQKCFEEQADENRKSEDDKLLDEHENVKESNEANRQSDNESFPESKESVKDGCQVYVVENLRPKEQKSESSVRVLVLVLNKPIKVLEMNSEASKVFGPHYYHCLTISYYQKHKQEKNVSLFPQNFDLENGSAKEIFERIRDVVTKTEVNVNFVITMPFVMWSAKREELAPFIDEGNRFRSVYW